MSELESDTRPWGRYQVICEKDECRVKHITIEPGKRNSYQRHGIRNEFWVVVSGQGDFLIDDVVIKGAPGSVIKIPIGTKHRWHNTGDEPLTLIEVQIGGYYGEDDIERLEDDFGREGTKETCIDGKLVR